MIQVNNMGNSSSLIICTRRAKCKTDIVYITTGHLNPNPCTITLGLDLYWNEQLLATMHIVQIPHESNHTTCEVNTS